MKIVINGCFGSFSLSEAGIQRYAEIKGIKLYKEADPKFSSFVHWYTKPKSERAPKIDWDSASMDERRAYNAASAGELFSDRDIPRDDPALIQIVEEMGHKADGRCASLEIVEIPDDVKWQIEEYDGTEHVAEEHRTWR